MLEGKEKQKYIFKIVKDMLVQECLYNWANRVADYLQADIHLRNARDCQEILKRFREVRTTTHKK